MSTVDAYFSHVSQEEFAKIKEKFQILLKQPDIEIDLEKYKPDENGYWYYTYITTTNYSHEFYIGAHSTKDIINDKYVGSGIRISRLISKYGINSFHRKILAFFNTHKEVYNAELLTITKDDLNSYGLLNLIGGGEGGIRGFKLSTIHKLKISARHKGKPLSEEHKKKISLSRTGQPLSDEHKQKIVLSHTPERRLKMSMKFKGRYISEKQRRQISIANTGRKHTINTKLIISSKLKGIKKSEEARQNMALARKTAKRRIFSDEVKLKMHYAVQARLIKLKESNIPYISEETKRKISIANTGKKRTDEERKKISEAVKLAFANMSEEQIKQRMLSHIGKKHTEEAKQKIGLGALGRKHTLESKIKMSLSKKGKKYSEETKAHMREARRANKEKRLQESSINENLI